MKSDSQSPLGVWSEISRAVLIANLLITLVAVGAQAAVLKATGADDLVQFAHVLGRTAPLALAVAAVVGVILWQLARDDFQFGLTLVAAALAFATATWIANLAGDLRVTRPAAGVQSTSWGLSAASEYGLAMLLAYYRAYGARDFWSSVIVGGALGWIWSRLRERAGGREPEASGEPEAASAAATAAAPPSAVLKSGSGKARPSKARAA